MKSEEVLYLSSLGLYSDQIEYLFKTYENPVQMVDGGGLNPELIQEKNIIKKYSKNRNDFDAYRAFMEKNRISYLSIFDEDYPENLKNIENPPYILYIKGNLRPRGPGISVVGARKCTDYGKWVCEKLVRDLSDYGVDIISGLALGIDKIAHQTALDNGLYTIGVLGCGVDRVYPFSNKKLFERMEEEGAIISEFPLGTEPLPHHFPIRNRIISGLAMGLLVIEARVKSGTLITANLAADQGRDVFAVPGNINSQFSQGTNALIRDGAKLVSCVEDIVNEMPRLQEIKEEAVRVQRDLSSLDEVDLKIYETLALEAKAIDEIARVLKLAMPDLMSRLTLLELQGLLVELDGKWTLN